MEEDQNPCGGAYIGSIFMEASMLSSIAKALSQSFRETDNIDLDVDGVGTTIIPIIHWLSSIKYGTAKKGKSTSDSGQGMGGWRVLPDAKMVDPEKVPGEGEPMQAPPTRVWWKQGKDRLRSIRICPQGLEYMCFRVLF